MTLDPIAGVLAERFELLYGPPEAEETASSLFGEDVAFEPLGGDAIDIGEAVAQEFSLALPPFPRSPETRVEAKSDAAAVAQSVCRIIAAHASRQRRNVRRISPRCAAGTTCSAHASLLP